MFSLQKLLGKEDKFHDLLDASAAEARASIQTLIKYLQNPAQLKALDEFILSRRKEKAIHAQISEALCTTFVTALEREDIEALSNAVYKIPKTVEKVAERIMLAPHFLQEVDVSKQVALLESAAETVILMIRELRKGVHLERIKNLNDRLQAIEGEADKMLVELLRDLYSRKLETIRVVFLKDLFELLEKVADRCRDSGNVITHIVLKSS
jgi:uncharacterized protein Yka (UPF0111/DUF47 family)